MEVFILPSWTSGEAEHCIEGEKLPISDSLDKQRKGTVREEEKGEERLKEMLGYKISLPEEYPNQALAPISKFSNEFL